MRRKSALSGSRGAINGAVRATRTMNSPTTPPASDRGLRRPKAASSTTAPIMALVADPRVEPPVGQVHEDVHGHEDQGVEQHEILHDDDVALHHRGDEGAAETWHAERLLDRHRA